MSTDETPPHKRRTFLKNVATIAGISMIAPLANSASTFNHENAIEQNPENNKQKNESNPMKHVKKDVPFITYTPVVIPVPGRQVDLEMKISAPATGNNLPILVFSHGHGPSTFLSSLKGYNPLIEFYAAQGFVVIQPTHQNSKTLNLNLNGPEGPLFWKSRAQDMHFIVDHLDHIAAAVPGLSSRIDKTRIAAMGHSMGGHTLCMLSGMTVTDPLSGEKVHLPEPRFKARVILAAPGKGSDLAAFASEHYPVLKNNDLATMTLPALVVAGDKDKNPNFSDRDDWRADPYTFSKGPKCMFTIFGAEHMLGGISGYDVAETSDENPERVAFVRESILAYLRSTLYSNDSSWEDLKKEVNGGTKGRIDCK
ncbi:alpha/beta fold hydrolase [Fulvivirgaceae bacterium PWU5]|uniref:Alpha/beta fold hydrolase n=1 Tax=Dawidia cretensis TaxID=2782350 RepID=A0AAP2DXW5_9BACT|nr:alpha/beta fold hydrolase [Dawidia cretensis]MBT1709670.1 alpha/beta fold hydrolase [Dawidia cretensis]